MLWLKKMLDMIAIFKNLLLCHLCSYGPTIPFLPRRPPEPVRRSGAGSSIRSLLFHSGSWCTGDLVHPPKVEFVSPSPVEFLESSPPKPNAQVLLLLMPDLQLREPDLGPGTFTFVGEPL